MDYKDYQSDHSTEDFWFKGKNNLIEILLAKVCNERRNLKILNVGVGTGDDLKILNQYGKNYIVDIKAEALALIDSQWYEEKNLASACALPYRDSFFDLAVSFDVFEHIEDDELAIKEVYRVLKPEGSLVFTVPAIQFLFSNHDQALNHYRRYNRKSLKNLLALFQSSKIFYWNTVLFLPIALIRILNKKKAPKIDNLNLPIWVNNIFYQLLSIDNWLINKNISLPFGLSLVGFCFKGLK